MNISTEQIADWKAKHGVVKKIQFDDAVGYIRKPTRKDLSYANTVSNGGKDNIKFSDALLNNCFLGGDEIIKKEDKYAITAGNMIATLIEVKEAELLDC